MTYKKVREQKKCWPLKEKIVPAHDFVNVFQTNTISNMSVNPAYCAVLIQQTLKKFHRK